MPLMKEHVVAGLNFTPLLTHPILHSYQATEAWFVFKKEASLGM